MLELRNDSRSENDVQKKGRQLRKPKLSFRGLQCWGTRTWQLKCKHRGTSCNHPSEGRRRQRKGTRLKRCPSKTSKYQPHPGQSCKTPHCQRATDCNLQSSSKAIGCRTCVECSVCAQDTGGSHSFIETGSRRCVARGLAAQAKLPQRQAAATL